MTISSEPKQTSQLVREFGSSEFSTTPKAVIVHDPTEFAAFNGGFGSCNQEKLQQYYLFRDQPNVAQFHADHQEFVKTLKSLVPKVLYVSEILSQRSPAQLAKFSNYLSTNPNQVYTRDALITIPWIPNGYIVGNMGTEIRYKEAEVMSCVADLLGLEEIVKVPDELPLEGGDVIPFCHQDKKYLLVGYDKYTPKESLYFLQSELVPKGIIDGVIGIKLAQWRINLDCGMVPVAEDVIVAETDSLLGGILLDSSETKIDPIGFFKDLGFNFIEVTKEESVYKLGCNCFCVGERTIVAYDLPERVHRLLEQHDVKAIKIKGKELVKGTGGPRCMTRPIYQDVK